MRTRTRKARPQKSQRGQRISALSNLFDILYQLHFFLNQIGGAGNVSQVWPCRINSVFVLSMFLFIRSALASKNAVASLPEVHILLMSNLNLT